MGIINKKNCQEIIPPSLCLHIQVLINPDQFLQITAVWGDFVALRMVKYEDEIPQIRKVVKVGDVSNDVAM